MSNEHARTIRVHRNDNVTIVAQVQGLPKGSVLEDGTVLIEDVPFGHKVALCDFEDGSEIRRYNEIIALAKGAIAKGSWISDLRVSLPPARDLEELAFGTRSAPIVEPLEAFTFEGYRNADGSVGTRNILGVTTSVQCVAGVVDHAVQRIKDELLPRFPNVDDVLALNHAYGCGVAIQAPEAVIPIRTLQNLALNPNFGGEIMIIGLGCEKLIPENLLLTDEENASILRLQEERFTGFAAMVDEILIQAEAHLERLNGRTRQPCPVSDLVVGMQCGGSDAFSGITANPAVGFATDLIVRGGGSVMFSEVTEVRDAVHLMAERVADVTVGKALIREMVWYDNYLDQGGVDRSANTTPGNKQGGLSGIIEKALGSIAKSGSSPIVDVLAPGERLRKKGLTFAATPASDFVCGTLQLASGMNIQVFTTGRGTPYNLAAAPVIKVATNSVLATRWHDLMDLDAGRIAAGDATIEQVGWELFQMILDVASDRKSTAADRLGLYNALTLFNPAPIT